MYIGEAEPVTGVGEGLDNRGEFRRVDVAFAVALGREIHEIDDPGKGGVLPHDRAHGFGQMLADVLGPGVPAPIVERPRIALASADDDPPRLRRQVEAQQIVVAFGDLLCDFSVADLLGQPVDLVVEDIREPLEKEEGQQVVLEFRSILFPADGAGRVPQHLFHGLRGGGCGANLFSRHARRGCLLLSDDSRFHAHLTFLDF